MTLNPVHHSAQTTREITCDPLKLVQSLEGTDHVPQVIATFLMRCLLTVFAQTVGLLSKCAFISLLGSKYKIS